MKKKKYITHKEFKKEVFKRHGVKKAHEDFGFEFQVIEAMIDARVKKGVTQKQLAQKIGVAQSSLARFESGRINPRLSFLKKVTHGLGLTLTLK